MMQAAELIRAVEQAGGHLEPDGDGLMVKAPEPLSESIMTALRAHKADLLDFLTRPVARVVLFRVPEGVPETWAQGICDLLAMACPASCPAERWNVLREDSYCLLRDWAARAHALNWMARDLFGAHPEKPLERFDCAGLALVLNGAAVVALSDTEAAIERPNGTRVTFHKRDQVPDEACLIWELET